MFEEIEVLQDEENLALYNMDKLWDGLHCLLTGESATRPIGGNLLSEAIIGTDMFSNDEDADFIAYIDPNRLVQVLAALEDVAIDKLIGLFSPEAFAQKEIYPNIWTNTAKETLAKELASEFNGLKTFYQKMVEKQKGVIVSIY